MSDLHSAPEQNLHPKGRAKEGAPGSQEGARPGATRAAGPFGQQSWLPDIPRPLKILHVSLGFFGWYLLNALLWQFPGLVCVFLPLNILLAYVLVRTRRGWMAQGLFIAWVSNLLFSLISGTFLDALLLVPFFINLSGG